MSTRTTLGGVVFSLAFAGIASAPSDAGPVDPTGLTPVSLGGSPGQVSPGTAFNPAISVIPGGVYDNDSLSGDGQGLLGQVDGFGYGHAHVDEEGHSHRLDLIGRRADARVAARS